MLIAKYAYGVSVGLADYAILLSEITLTLAMLWTHCKMFLTLVMILGTKNMLLNCHFTARNFSRG